MQNYKIYTLEDTLEYQEVDSILLNNYSYILMSQINDPTNICIRKLVLEEDNNYFYKLDNYEFENVINTFLAKNKNLFE